MIKNFLSRLATIVLALMIVATGFVYNVPCFAETDTNNNTEPLYVDEEGEVMILFTHDIHSHLDPFTVMNELGRSKVVGGMSRMKTVIDEERSKYHTSFLFDAGDFSMGTLYQVLFSSHAAELVTMGRMGYDATTFGNHEFDYLPQGMADWFHSAIREAEEEGITLPHFVPANINWEKSTKPEDLLIKEAMDDYGASSYAIIERNGIKVGVFGLQGEESREDAPLATLEFMNIVDAAKIAVAKLQEEGCDMIVALSHSGTRENDKKSEDVILAKEVPEIDFIVSGHTHRKLEEPLIVGHTVIGSVECYGQYLGEASFVPDGNGRWTLRNYRLLEITGRVHEDPEIAAALADYKPLIDEEYLSRFGFNANDVIAYNQVAFAPLNRMEGYLRECSLGNLIADAYIYAVQSVEGDKYKPVAVALTPVGVIRDTIAVGDVTAEDAFNISSLGIGPDGIPGYPIIECYLTGEEIRALAEVDVSVSKIMPPAQLYPSGAKWTYNNHRILLNRVMDVELVDTSNGVPSPEAYYKEEGIPLEKDKLYRVVGGLYSMQMMAAVEAKSYGLLKVQPKDEFGVPIEDFNKCIIYDKEGNEMKEWYALACYLSSFSKNEDGVSIIPPRYANVDGRKVESTSRNLGEVFGHPNMVGKAVYAIVGIIIIMILGIVTVIKKLHKKNKKK